VGKVLVVEDDLLVAEVLQEMLSSRATESICVATAKDAVVAMVTSNVSAVLTDGRLPGKNGETPRAHGLQIAEIARWMGLYCVLLTADDTILEEARTLGIPAVLKPASIEEICRLLGVR